MSKREKKKGGRFQAVMDSLQRGDYLTAEKHSRVLLASVPEAPEIYLHMGIAIAKQGVRQNEAIEVYRRGLLYSPDSPALHTNLAGSLGATQQWQAAYAHAKRATELAPNDSACWHNLIHPCHMTGRLHDGEQAARTALGLGPTPANRGLTWVNLANILREQGRLEEALEAYRESIQLLPNYPIAHINLLLTLQSLEQATPEELLAEAGCYAERYETPHIPEWPSFSERNAEPWRRLRVGFISPDFKNHSVMYFAESVLCLTDRRLFEVTAFYLQSGGDQVTERVMRHVDRFVDLGGMQPRQQASAIQLLEIDILIDLAGHTANTGLLAMVYKPAPVQITWLGYPGTTGLKAVDWRITDAVADTLGSDVQYTEKLARIPAPFCVYRPCLRWPLRRYMPEYQVRPAPALTNGFITFGSCNSLSKLTGRVLKTWAQLLERIPTARLLIEGWGLDNEVQHAEFTNRCQQDGIPMERMELLHRDTRNQYLTYHGIDIALDPFPLTGGTTSFDTLWMGVPFVTMNGDSFRSRMGVTILDAAGLTGWIARDEEEYVEIAIRLATDITALNTIRLKQRRQVETSPIMDEFRFARYFEEVLRHSWLRWCAKRIAGEDKSAIEDQLVQWSNQRTPSPPPELLISIAPGERIPMSEVKTRLQGMLTTAMTEKPVIEKATELDNVWRDVVQLATLVLESTPKEPLALASLAEAEYAHGGLQAAISYLSHAVDAAPQNSRLHQRLIDWHSKAGNARGAEQIRQLMQQRGMLG